MAVLVGKNAPDFKATAVVNGDFKQISLSDYKGKFVLLFFYPLDFTFVCPTEMIAFQEKAEAFKKLNTEIIGVSVDSQFSHLAWLNTKREDGGIDRRQLGKRHMRQPDPQLGRELRDADRLAEEIVHACRDAALGLAFGHVRGQGDHGRACA